MGERGQLGGLGVHRSGSGGSSEWDRFLYMYLHMYMRLHMYGT